METVDEVVETADEVVETEDEVVETEDEVVETEDEVVETVDEVVETVAVDHFTCLTTCTVTITMTTSDMGSISVHVISSQYLKQRTSHTIGLHRV